MSALRTITVVRSAAFACVSVGAAYQDPGLKPNFGTVKLKAGFTPNPFKKDVVAGGKLKVDKEGVEAFISKEPDFV